ncbi:MAG: hypothetical protein M3Y41_10210 [Pseudomonadota bacterium]|nr:hypothetical protein [Pseudomonadota bacterium]
MTFRLTIAAAAVSALGLGYSPSASAIGCFTGGAAGAVAGHMAHHGVIGALGGCVAGHEAHKYQKHRAMREEQAQQQQYNAYPQSPPNAYHDRGPGY